MANFYNPGQQTSDPNYLRQSREPDRQEPLRQVAVPAINNNDSSWGKLFEGLGNTTELVASAVDQGIKRNIKEDAFAMIDPIRSEHGADVTPDEAAQIAGTGAKGRARTGALFGGTPVDGDGNPTPNGTTAPGNSGVEDKPLPEQATNEIGRLRKMNDAYAAGKLSDSYYNAELVAKTKELRARYPGYRDQVDAAVSDITGIVPANALRKSLISDLNANAAAQAGKANSWQSFTEKKGDLIVQDRPDYFANPGKYAGQETQIRSDVFQREGRSAYIKAQEQEIGFDSSRAEQVGIQKANLIASTGIAGVSNAAGLGDTQSMQNKMLDFAKKGGADPKELAQLSASVEALRAAKETEIYKSFNTQIEGRQDGGSLSSVLKSPEKQKAIVEQALQPYNAIRDALKNQNFQLASTIATQVTMQKNQAAKEIMDKVPAIRIIAGISQAGGDQAMGTILQGSQLLPQLQKSLSDSKLIETMGMTDPAKPPPGISAQLAEVGKAAPASGPLAKSLIEGNMKIIMSPDIGATVSAAGVRNLFDQKFFAQIKESERVQVVNQLSSPVMTQRIAELSKQDPGLMQQYTSWTKYALSSVLNQDIANARDGAQDERFTTKYNPETNQIQMTPKAGYFPGQDGRGQKIGDAYVQKVNQGLKILEPIFKANGQDVKAGNLEFIQQMGIDLSSKASANEGNGVLRSVGQQLKAMFQGPDSGAPVLAGAPQLGKGTTSLTEAPEAKMREVIGSAESGGDYNSIFGMGKGASRDLSQNTVGEIMAMQKHYTDNGSPSSAVGKYQFIRKTLASLVKDGAVSADDQFTPELQDQLAHKLMERRGLNDFRSGKISREAYVNNLAKEWAGLPTTSGMSFYEGDGLNKSTVRLPSVLAALSEP